MGPVWDGQEKDLISTTLGCQGVWGGGKILRWVARLKLSDGAKPGS